MKYNLSITAHVGDERDTMTIYSKDYDKNITDGNSSKPVLKMIRDLMPCIFLWIDDDGDDVPGTKYCQYTYYEPGTDNYLLAAWYEIDEQKGCIKL